MSQGYNVFQLINDISPYLGNLITQEAHLRKYSKTIISAFFDKNFIRSIQSDVVLSLTSLDIFAFLIGSFEIDQQLTELYVNVTNAFLTEEAYKINRDVCENFLIKLWGDFLIKFRNFHSYAFNLAKRIDSYNDKNSFSAAKTIISYLCYLNKDFNNELLDCFLVVIRTSEYEQQRAYVTFNFYKGMCFIAKQSFNEAAICFLLTLKVQGSSRMSETVFTHHQIESIKRLIMIYVLCNSEVQKMILAQAKQVEVLFGTKDFEPFSRIRKVLFNLKSGYIDLMKLLKDDGDLIKKNKLGGIFRLAIEKSIISTIRTIQKIYIKMTLEDLSKECEVPSTVLFKYLKKFAISGDLVFKYDEMTDVIDFSFDNESMKVQNEKLKDYYNKMNALQFELISSNFISIV